MSTPYKLRNKRKIGKMEKSEVEKLCEGTFSYTYPVGSKQKCEGTFTYCPDAIQQKCEEQTNKIDPVPVESEPAGMNNAQHPNQEQENSPQSDKREEIEDWFITSQPKSMMKEFLESGLQNAQSETNPNTCKDGCTCEKYGHEVDLNIDYQDLIHSHFMSQPETDDHFAFLDKLNHLNNRQKMIKTKQNEEEERLEQKTQSTGNKESNQLDKENQEKKDH